MGLPEPGQAEGGLGLGLALVALAYWPGLTGMSVGGSGPSGGAGSTRWSKGGTQNQGQEELIRRQPRRARGHNRAEGPPGTAPSLPRINREEGEGRGSVLEEEGCPSCLGGHLLIKCLGRYPQHPTEWLSLPACWNTAVMESILSCLPGKAEEPTH